MRFVKISESLKSK